MSKILTGMQPAEMFMGIMAKGTILPFHIIGQMDAPKATKERLNNCLAKELMRLFSGQAADLNLCSNKDFSINKLEKIVEWRQPISLYAQLACELANAPLDVSKYYHDAGVKMDLAMSLSKDLYECFTGEYADLKNGTRTLYFSVCLDALPKNKRGWFIGLLDDANKNEESLQKVLSELRKVYMVQAFASQKNNYIDNAQQMLKQAKPKEPYLSFLNDLIEAQRPITLFY